MVFVKYFRQHLLGRHFVLRTDHGSLAWLRNFHEPERQMAHWLETLQEYDFQVLHRRGQSRSNVDAMSLRPSSQCGRPEQLAGSPSVQSLPMDTTAQLAHVTDRRLSATPTTTETEQDIVITTEAQLCDPAISVILKAKEQGE